MKELSNMFARRYSAVSQKDDCVALDEKWLEKCSKKRKSLSRDFSFSDSCCDEKKKDKSVRRYLNTFLLVTGGLLAIATGILFQVYHPYDLIFRWKLVFGEGGEIFNLWEKPPVDLYVKIYLFNITNADEFMAGREKLRVEQVGPYVYKELMEHGDIIFNENDTLSSRPRHPLVFDQELSGERRENDTLMMVNIALLSIAQVGADKSYFVRLPINILIRQTRSMPIVKMTAHEFMFGYETKLTTLGNTFLPDWIVFDKVGLIDRMYDFNADYETFYTGTNDPSLSGLYATYRGSKDLPQWRGDEHCSNIEMASDGTKFKSFIEPNDTLLFFRKSMCRAQKLIRISDEEEVISGLQAYRYGFEENALDNGYYNEENKCFCRNGYCQPRGLSDVTDCYYGFPISLSYPHFLDSDPMLLENVDGLTPNRSEHESFFLINPTSGLPLSLAVKFQINMHMRDVSSMAHVERFSDITLPMLWFEIMMKELPKPLRSRFNLYLNILPYIEVIGFWGGVTVGIMCIVFAILKSIFKMPSFLKPSQIQINQNSEKHTFRSSIYQPCEMKLIEAKDKFASSKTKGSDAKIMIYDLEGEGEQNYVLEREPAISEDSNESIDCELYANLSEESESHDGSENKNYQKDSYKGSYVESRRRSTDNNKQNWLMGDASSLIEDIGTDQFSSLIKSDDYDSDKSEEYTNAASIV